MGGFAKNKRVVVVRRMDRGPIIVGIMRRMVHTELRVCGDGRIGFVSVQAGPHHKRAGRMSTPQACRQDACGTVGFGFVKLCMYAFIHVVAIGYNYFAFP